MKSASLSIICFADERSSYRNRASAGASVSISTLTLIFTRLVSAHDIQRRHAFRSGIRLSAFDQVPQDSIKRVLVRRIDSIEIQFERCLRTRALCRVQLVKPLLRFCSHVRSQIRFVRKNLTQGAAIIIELRELSERSEGASC